jgi:DNA-binding CsgD family transcriptional regulator
MGQTMARNDHLQQSTVGAGSKTKLAVRGWQLVNRAAIDAVRGRESSCRAGAAAAGILGQRSGFVALDVAAEHVLGLLELSVRNLPVAAWHLARCERMTRTWRLFDPYVVRFEPDLVEVLVSLGRHSEAELVVASLEARARRSRSSWAAGAAARCRGMLEGENAFDAKFISALAIVSREGYPFERARTELWFGERLRRARRRSEARGHLAMAHELFQAIGAAPWCDRAARELQATSMTSRRRGDPTSIDDLTPQEHQVVQFVAGGATVRDAATRMFLSPKTVEAHLGRAYRKLGVHNRAQLAIALARKRSADACDGRTMAHNGQ